MSKFEKYRSVDSMWLNVPSAYAAKVKGAHQNQYDEYKAGLTLEMLYRNHKLYDKFIQDLPDDIKKKYNDLMDSDDWNSSFDFLDNYAEKVYIPNYNKTHKKRKLYDKTFTVIQIYGSTKALCGWRNGHKCNMGMTFMCPIIRKNGNRYIKYKGKLINFKDLSWVF